MQKLFVLFVITLLVGLPFNVAAQTQDVREITDPTDPMIKLVIEFIDHSWSHGAKEIERFVFAEKVHGETQLEQEAKRIALIGRFADGFVFITNKKVEAPTSPWATVNRDHFKVVRPVDEKGKPKDTVVVRFDPPEGLSLNSKLDYKRYNRVEWHLTFKEKKGKPLIETVTQHFLNIVTAPAITAGVSSTLQWNHARKRLFT